MDVLSPRISVIVPVYNAECFIEDCCRQLQGQTISSQIEVILVDDGSTDRSLSLCDKVQKTYQNVIALRQDHQGVSAARNLGVRFARGEYVAFVDVDDRYDSDMLETELGIAVATGADVVCMDAVSQDPQETVVLDGAQEAIGCLLRNRIEVSCWNKLFSRAVIPPDPFPVGVRVYEDLHALYSIFIHVRNVACRNIVKYHYVRRAGSSSRTKVFTEKYFDGLDVADSIAGDIKERFPGLQGAAEARKALLYLRISKLYWLRGAPRAYRERIDYVRRYLSKVPRNLIREHFSRNDRIRLTLYLHCFPVFRFMVKTIDTN